MAQFDIQDLTFSYPGQRQRTLDHVTLSIEPGSCVCVCGRSGCGKTTLLRHLKTALTPHGETSGRVVFDGVPLSEVPLLAQAQLIGFVMQDPDAQVVTDKVWHELAFGLENLGMDQRAMRLRIAEVVGYLGIEDWFDKEVSELSGGQKQLLNLASIMVMQPKVLILDEPTSQLDPIAAAGFLDMVRKINRDVGTTVIIAEQRLEEVFAEADQAVVLEDGRVSVAGAPKEAAESLCAAGSPLTLCLPTAARVAHGVAWPEPAEGVRPASDRAFGAWPPSSSADRRGSRDLADMPLTVREGRAWLAERMSHEGLSVRAVPAAPAPADACGEPALSLKDVWLRYERDAPDVLRGATLDIPAGKIFAIVGGNGAGKSTLLRVICGIEKPYRGAVRVLGRKLKEWKGRSLFQGALAMLPQDPQSILVKKTVKEDLEEMLDGRADGAERLREAARTCGVEGVLDRHPLDLSGGERQRAALAKVLLCEPRVLLLDEPTKGIDALFKHALKGVLRRLAASGMTIVMVSHDVEFCAHASDAVSMLFNGSMIAADAPRAFFSANSFYTTEASRMSRGVFADAVTDDDVIRLVRINEGGGHGAR